MRARLGYQDESPQLGPGTLVRTCRQTLHTSGNQRGQSGVQQAKSKVRGVEGAPGLVLGRVFGEGLWGGEVGNGMGFLCGDTPSRGLFWCQRD